MLKILIADDFPVVLHGLKRILEEEFTDASIVEVDTGNKVIEKSRIEKWDVIILDINMPGRNGLEILKQLKYEFPGTPVLILSMYPEDQYAIRAMKLGAAGYLTKKSASDELITAIKQILSGRKYISSSLAETLAGRLKKDSDKQLHEYLSDRELQVLCMIANGKDTGAIADELSLSASSISTYRARILEKMDMRTNAELINYAIKHELV
ncbi:MAG: response regulator transcription factor [Bacteroidetes bacterium]|nr:response regulator transcription factor [Bacteroidota bacterium]